MIGKLQRIGRVKDDRDRVINTLIDRINLLSTIKGTGGIKARVHQGGVSLSSIDVSGGGGGSTALRNAFAVLDASDSNEIECHLDTDGTGESVTVVCEIVGGTALNNAIPRLEDGDRLTVWNDSGTWRCTTIFQTTTDCT